MPAASLPREGRGSQLRAVARRRGPSCWQRPSLGRDEDRNLCQADRDASWLRAASLPREGRGSQRDLDGRGVYDQLPAASLPREGRGSQPGSGRHHRREDRAASLPREGRGSQRVGAQGGDRRQPAASLPREGRGSQPHGVRGDELRVLAASLPREGRGSQRALGVLGNKHVPAQRPSLGRDEDRNTIIEVVEIVTVPGSVPPSGGTRIATASPSRNWPTSGMQRPSLGRDEDRNRSLGCGYPRPDRAASLPREGRGSQHERDGPDARHRRAASLPREGRGSQPCCRRLRSAVRHGSVPPSGGTRIATTSHRSSSVTGPAASLPREGRGSQPIHRHR